MPFLFILKAKKMCCCELDFDNMFLLMLTAISIFVVFVDLKVLEKMFEEYFMLENYINTEVYDTCYKP